MAELRSFFKDQPDDDLLALFNRVATNVSSQQPLMQDLAAELMQRGGHSVVELAQLLGVSRPTLYSWAKQAEERWARGEVQLVDLSPLGGKVGDERFKAIQRELDWERVRRQVAERHLRRLQRTVNEACDEVSDLATRGTPYRVVANEFQYGIPSEDDA